MSADAANAYASANGLVSIPVAEEEKPTGQVLVAMTAIREQVEAGQAAAFDVAVTNQSEYSLYAVDVTAGPEGGEFTDLPEGVEASGSTVQIEELAPARRAPEPSGANAADAAEAAIQEANRHRQRKVRPDEAIPHRFRSAASA